MDSLIQIIVLAIILVISIWFHEYAHAWVSYILWDPTPKLQWRLTPNPLKHIDPIGFLMIFLIHFWWWKPVQVNPMYYKNKLRDELLVALAGPFANFLMAFIGSALYVLFARFWLLDPLTQTFLYWFIFINIALAIFNLIPIYPLDWYRIIKFLNPSLIVAIEYIIFFKDKQYVLPLYDLLMDNYELLLMVLIYILYLLQHTI